MSNSVNVPLVSFCSSRPRFLDFSHFELLLSETDLKLIITQANLFEPARSWIPMRHFTQLRDIKSDRSSFHRRAQFQTFRPKPGLPDWTKITLQPYSYSKFSLEISIIPLNLSLVATGCYDSRCTSRSSPRSTPTNSINHRVKSINFSQIKIMKFLEKIFEKLIWNFW